MFVPVIDAANIRRPYCLGNGFNQTVRKAKRAIVIPYLIGVFFRTNAP